MTDQEAMQKFAMKAAEYVRMELSLSVKPWDTSFLVAKMEAVNAYKVWSAVKRINEEQQMENL